jgi:multiple sugar transport system permease protein
MLKEFFSQVPRPLFDAGIIDGVNPYQMFLHIYMPQASSPIATLFIIAFMNNWNDLLRPMLYISSRELYTVTIALSLFQNQYGVKWNLLLAGSVLSVLPLIIIFAFSQRYIIESTMSSGIKG